MALWSTYGYAYLWWPGSRVRAKPWLPRFFRGALTQLPIRILREPGVEVTDETGKLPPHISAVLNSAPHHIGSHARGAGCFAAEGLNKKAISSPLRPPVARRERIHPFRLPRFCRHFPVGQPQKLYWYQRKGAIKKVPQAHRNYSLFIIHY